MQVSLEGAKTTASVALAGGDKQTLDGLGLAEAGVVTRLIENV